MTAAKKAAAPNQNQAANGPTDGETAEGQAKKDMAGQESTTGRPSVSDVPGGTPSAAATEGAAVDPRLLQPGEEFGATPTTNPPRGVGEPAADALADEPAARELQEHVQEVIDAEEAQGFRGVKTNVVPNKNYTLAGVNAGEPTPETTVVTPRAAQR